MKKILPLFCAVLALGLLAACGSGSKVKDDVAAADVSKAVVAALPAESFTAASETYVTGVMKMDGPSFKGFDVEVNSKGENIDMFGVFQGTDEKQTAEIKKACEDYLQMRKDTWMPEYMPAERPKLDDAEIKVAGNYVMFAILSESDKTAAFGAFEKALQA